MGISHRYKIIYVSIPKTGSQSIASLLSNTSDSFHKIHEHLTYREMLCLMDETHFYTYRSFTVVRNPYDRIKSIYYEYSKHLNTIDFSLFIKKIYNEFYDLNNDIFRDDAPIFIKPQYSFCCYDGNILVDNILPFESINESWKQFTTDYIPELINTIFPITNVSFKNIPNKIIFTTDDYRMINKMYNMDFTLFGYSKIQLDK